MSEEKPKHPLHLEGWNGTLEERTISVGRMRYDKVAEFTGYLARYAEHEAQKDTAAGKVRLPGKLFSASQHLYQAQEEYDSAWKIRKRKDNLSLIYSLLQNNCLLLPT